MAKNDFFKMVEKGVGVVTKAANEVGSKINDCIDIERTKYALNKANGELDALYTEYGKAAYTLAMTAMDLANTTSIVFQDIALRIKEKSLEIEGIKDILEEQMCAKEAEEDVESVFCSRCGKEYDNKEQFCSACGSKLHRD